MNLKPYAQRKTTLSILMVDGSWSMDKHGNAPVVAVNNYLDQLREDRNTNHLVGVVIFNDDFRVAIPVTPVHQVGRYTGYRACGNTLLYRSAKRVLEGVADSWDGLTEREQANLSFYFTIISDGEDNRSPRKNYPEALASYAIRGRRDGWVLACNGLGISGQLLAQAMSFDPALAETFDANEAGIELATRRAGDLATRRRAL
ncbi:MAG: hypothetical protein AAB473_02200 [Patescibacteria group bacterium]